MNKKVRLMIPTEYNSGEEVAEEIIKSIKVRIRNITGGISSYNVEGQFVGEEEIYYDNNICIETITEEEKIEEIKEEIKNIKIELKQESMYFEIQNVDVSFI